MGIRVGRGTRGGRLLSDGRRIYWWREVFITLGLYSVYSAIRNLSEGSTKTAYEHARELMHWQRMVGLNIEETLQDWALHVRPLIIALNYLYGSLHFIVTAFVIVWLFRRHSDDYPRFRNTLAFMTVMALVGFMTWPLMPPRLLPEHYGFVDTLARYPTFWSFDSGTLHDISNQYAAMPSLHFGWSMWCACALVPRLRNRFLRIAAACYPLMTLAAIVLTGNHYFFDALGGVIVFGVAYVISERFTPAGRASAAARERARAIDAAAPV